MTNLDRVQNIHFIGIGGIGLSAIARMMLVEGKNVTGSDVAESIVTNVLEDAGAKIEIGHEPDLITEDTDLVIYTIAIEHDDPEFVKARELNIPCMTYPEALGALSENKYTIAVTGTHGKTSTTGMLAQILIEAGKDPSVVIGSFLKGYKSNFIAGKSDILLTESCEYRRSFLHMHPNIVVITNVMEEHLDYYRDLEDIQSAFIELVKKIPEDGYLVCNPKDPNVMPIVREAFCHVVDYSMEKIFFELAVPGEHQLQNAKAAIAVSGLLDIPRGGVTETLTRFKGTWRRSDYLGETKRGALIYDDYAHHPDEIKTTLKGFKERFKNKKLTVIFQPHLHSRTKKFFNEFVESFDVVDKLILLPIYAARAESDHSVSSEDLRDALFERGVNVVYIDNRPEIVELINNHHNQTDLVMTMGAGDVYRIAESLTNWQK